jgi:GNAT superfamily N-acetyltransferase
MTATLGTTGRPSLPPADRLAAHLRSWLGAWPPTRPLTIVELPPDGPRGWDGRRRDVGGVARPALPLSAGQPDGGSAVLAVPAGRAAAVRAAAQRWTDLPETLAAAVGRPGTPVWVGKFRWTIEPSDLPDIGVWIPVGDPRLPDWLRPFGGDALIALEHGRYAAGVGLKRHNPDGVEIAVGTDPGHRGKGLAARLVAQAARRILAAGAVPVYIHDPANIASARTAAAAGFPDRGWQAIGMPPADTV